MPDLFLPSIFLFRRSGWNPGQMSPVFWPGGFDPSRGHLFQDEAGTSPALDPGDLVSLLQAGIDASQASVDAAPRLGRWPAGGRRNMLLHSEDFGEDAWAAYFVKPARSVSPDSLSDVSATQRLIFDPAAHESHFSGVFFDPPEEPSGVWSYRLKFRFVDRIPAVVRIGMDDGLSGAQTLNGESIAPDGDNLAPLLSVGVVYTLEGRADATGSVNGRALQIYFQDDASVETATMDISEVQSESGSDPTGYQRVGSAHDVVEQGTRDVWHLSDGGGASLSALFPAATYTRAFVDHLGAVTIESSISIGGMQDVLRAERLADVLYVDRDLTAAESARLTSYWRRRYTAWDITGTGPVLAALTDGDALGDAVTWGSYSSPHGEVSVTRQMLKAGGSWIAYVAATAVAEGEEWQIRELVDDGVGTPKAFTSAAQEVEAVPATAPAKVATPTLVSKGDSTIKFSWVAPDDGGAAITAYRVYVGGTLAVGNAISPHELVGLDPETPYSITVSAANAVGEGAQSDALVVTTDATVTAPAITSVVFDGEAEPMTLSFSVDRDCTVYWAWVDSSVAKSGAALFDIVDQNDGDFIHGSVAMVTGINYPTIADQPTGSGEYWLQFVAKADGLYSTVQVVGPVDAIQVGLFSETWGSWSAGATEDNLLSGGWSPGGVLNTAPQCTIITDPDAPQGKSLSLPRTTTADTGSNYFISRNDIDAALAGSWTSLDLVALLRVPTTIYSRAHIQLRDEDFTEILSLNYMEWGGIQIGCSAAGAGSLAKVIPPAIDYGDIAWIRIQLFDGNKARGKAWTGAIGDEPASWASTKTGSTWSSFVAPRLGIYQTNARSNYAGVLGFWVGIDRDAEVPSW